MTGFPGDPHPGSSRREDVDSSTAGSGAVGEDMLPFTDFGVDMRTVLEQVGFRVDTFRDGNDPSGASWVVCGLVPSEPDE